jgi:parvulin-like peptidyl-prolyl isomerase
MKHLILLSLFAIPLCAQAPEGKPEPVVATINGKDYTKAEIERMVQSIGGTIPMQFASNRRGFVETLGLTLRLEEEARKLGLDKREPYAAQLAYNTMIFLAQTVLNEKNKEAKIFPEQQKAHYEKNKRDYSSAKVKVLYLAFTTSAMPGPVAMRSEADAKGLLVKIQGEMKAGANFVEMIRKYSDDADSKAKDGDFPPVKPTDSTLPPDIRGAIFGLEPGQVSAPIRQANGYYLFQLVSLETPPFEELRDQIFMDLQKVELDKWMDVVRSSVKVEFKDETFFGVPAPR